MPPKPVKRGGSAGVTKTRGAPPRTTRLTAREKSNLALANQSLEEEKEVQHPPVDVLMSDVSDRPDDVEGADFSDQAIPSTPTTPSSSTKKKKDRRKDRSVGDQLTEAQQEDAVQWLQENRFLYMKGTQGFKDRDLKIRTWEAKAKEVS